MILFLLAYLGGVLTIVSPCILPVLPFVFARSDRPFVRSGLPLLLAMIATFAVVATLASVVGGWAVAANQYGRLVALILLAAFGLILLFPSLSDRLTRPLVALGGRLSESADREGGSVTSSLLLGVATGLLWAPCAGPVLGLILTGAALNGANVGTSLLLAAYAAGAASSLALALLVGGRVFSAMKRSLGASEWIRRGLGAAVLVGVALIALGLDTGLLTRISLNSTASLEQRLLERLHPDAALTGSDVMMSGGSAMKSRVRADRAENLAIEGEMPSLDGAVEWLNSSPLTRQSLAGKVVLIDFWTYSCINCLRAIPYVNGWAEKYRDQGLVVIGVHAPEFAFERDAGNVRKAVARLAIRYPVALDNEYAIWRAFDNHYWPAHYFIDARGYIRHHHYGEGAYDVSEKVIQQLLAEAGHASVPGTLVTADATGVQAASNSSEVRSPETYIGYDRAENFISTGGAVRDLRQTYSAPLPRLNEWALRGAWTIRNEHAELDKPDGSVVYRFHARDLHLVLGPSRDGKAVRFKVTLDGAPPGESSGMDVQPDGSGTVTEQRLYQLLRQQGEIRDRTFEIRFLDSGVQAYAFTFG